MTWRSEARKGGFAEGGGGSDRSLVKLLSRSYSYDLVRED